MVVGDRYLEEVGCLSMLSGNLKLSPVVEMLGSAAAVAALGTASCDEFIVSCMLAGFVSHSAI